jgi:hypothetical protein
VINVASNATAGDGGIACEGMGINRVISLTLADSDLGDVDVNTAATTTLTISNTGNSLLEVTDITYPEGFSGSFSGTVAAGGSEDVTVTFQPTAASSYGGDINVVSNKSEGDNTIAIAGFGASRIISVSGNLDFGYVKNSQSAQRTLTITNNGNRSLNVSDITYPDAFSGSWSGTIAAAGSQQVTVTFAPTVGSSYSGSISINSDATSGTADIDCFGFSLIGDGSELDPYVLSEDYHIWVVDLEPDAY